jgi:monovalent cation:H+ antiporter-2, CPA2 family
MPHETSLIAAIAAGVGLAFVLGVAVSRVKLPPLLGYLLAGLAVGPFTPGFVADSAVTHQLSEIGVTLLMFGVGLHFSIKDLASVRKVALPGALVQIGAATLLGIGAGFAWGMSLGGSIVFGLCLSVASTVVLLRALADRQQLETANGRIAVGWLVVEDLVIIVALVMLPAAAVLLGGKPLEGSDGNLTRVLLETFLKLFGFVVLMLVLGKQVLPKLLGSVFRHGPRELFTTGIVAVALGIAFGASALFGVSPALGAFLAGVVIAESDLSHQASAEIKPLGTIFAVLFFVSIGMLFDPTVLLRYPGEIFVSLLIVIVGKSLASAMIMLAMKYPIGAALTISASLAQIGELSIVLAVGVLSIALNPLMFSLMDRLGDHLGRSSSEGKALDQLAAKEDLATEEASAGLEDHVVMIGYGRVGRLIGTALDRAKVQYVVVDFDRDVIDSLHRESVPSFFGDATRKSVLVQAKLATAKLLVIATPANSQTREIVEAAHSVRPDVAICVRTHHVEDYHFFGAKKIQRVVLGELETALQMVDFALEKTNSDPESSKAIIDSLRLSGAETIQRGSRETGPVERES